MSAMRITRFEHDARLGTNNVVFFGLGQGFDQLGRESGPGWMNSASFCKKERLSSLSGRRAGWGSDTAKGAGHAVVNGLQA
jgi:hypothetical protein